MFLDKGTIKSRFRDIVNHAADYLCCEQRCSVLLCIHSRATSPCVLVRRGKTLYFSERCLF